MLSSEVRNQDVIYLLRGVQASGISLAWQFVRDHWSTFLERYAGGMLLPHVVKVAGGFSSEADAEAVLAFFVEHPTKELEKTVAQAVEAIRAQASWRVRDDAGVKAWAASR